MAMRFQRYHEGPVLGLIAICVSCVSTARTVAQNDIVLSHSKISNTEGEFVGTLDDFDFFGMSLTSLTDLDGDGIRDLVVGASNDDDGANGAGALWVLFLNEDATVKSHQKISALEGGFDGVLDASDTFGFGVANLGDLDGDGVEDIAVSAHSDDDGGFNHGAVWILFLNQDGTVRTHQKISDTEGEFQGDLAQSDLFGTSVAFLGDLDGDGVGDIAVGAQGDSEDRGAVWILFLNQDGTVRAHQKINESEGGFTGTLEIDDRFGSSVAVLGDLDGDKVPELAVGASDDNDGGLNRGAVWILFLGLDGTVRSHQKISQTQGGFSGELDDNDAFGERLGAVGDLNNDGIDDLAAGARGDHDGGPSRGAVWILFMRADGEVKSTKKISDTAGGFTGLLDDQDSFGISMTSIGDIDGNGVNDLGVGAFGDDDGGQNRGAVWILNLNETDLCSEVYDNPLDCNANGLPDDCEINDGLAEDCNENGVPDECDQDCNTNSIPDDCDIANGTSNDCNDNDVPDECDIGGEFTFDSGALSPIGFESPQDTTIKSPPQALSDVQLTFSAVADLASVVEFIDVDINGIFLGSIFVEGAADCPKLSDEDSLIIAAELFNGTAFGSEAIITLTPSGAVNANACGGQSFVTVGVVYQWGGGIDDDNNNGIPDECETPGDLNGDGVVGAADLLILLSNWGPCGDCRDCVADLDGDCSVGASDLLILLANWG